jgi:hypothetical protein
MAQAAGKQELASGIHGLAQLYAQGRSYPDAREGAAMQAAAAKAAGGRTQP